MAEVSVLSLEFLEILIKWKSGELLKHEEGYGGGPPAHEDWSWLPSAAFQPFLKRKTRKSPYRVRCLKKQRSTNGTDGLEESLQSLIVERLREKVVKLDDLAEVLEVFKFELNSQLETAEQREIFRRLVPQIRQTIKNVSSELLQMRKRNPKMRLEEFKVYFDPVCWSSRKRLDFLCRLSDELSELSKSPQLSTHLDSKWRLHFKGNWITHIDGDFINKIDPDRRPRSRTFECLLRFVRNRWHHPGEFLEFRRTDNAEDFYNYFGELFPDLLRVAYGVAYRFCREEPWFEKFRPVKHRHVDTHRTRSDTRSMRLRNPTQGQPLPDTFGHACSADDGGCKRQRGSRDGPTASPRRQEMARERAARKGVVCGERQDMAKCCTCKPGEEEGMCGEQ